MKIGIVGAGAIGRFVGAKLLLAEGDVRFRVRRPDELGTLAIRVDAPTGEIRERGVAFPHGQQPIGSMDDRDVVLVCVKSGATAEIGTMLATELREGAVVISLQNGVRNSEVLRAALPKQTVLAGIVGFNVVREDPAVRQTTSGGLMIEASERAGDIVAALRGAGLDVKTPRDIVRHQYTKLLVNLGNAVSALSDASTREMMLSRGYRRILASLIGEALRVLKAAGIKPARLRGIPVGIVPAMMRLPTPIVRVVARAQLKIDPQARSSMHDDLTRGRATEIDELNGEIVRLADKVGVAAPLNAKIVDLVRNAERAAVGSPKLSAELLAGALAAGDQTRR